MPKKLTFIILSLLMIAPLFAQIPSSQIKEDYLSYNSSEDKLKTDFLWGATNDYTYSYNKDYGLDFLLKTGKVIFTIEEDGVKEKPTDISDEKQAQKNDLENKLNKENREKDFENIISDALKVWFKDTKKAIEKAGRQKEFDDIMPFLNRSVFPERITLNEVKDKKVPIINFYFTTEKNMHKICGDNAVGCEGTPPGSKLLKIISVSHYDKNKNPYFTRNNIYITIIHEIGHYYGLADQYKGSYNADEVYSTEDRVGKTSVMAGNDLSELRCDDIDGFINLIDLTLYYQRKHWSKRAKNGWASFCNGRKYYKDTFYKEAKPVNKRNDECVYTFKKDGTIDKKYCPKPFTLRNAKDTLTYDNATGLLSKKVDAKFTYKYYYNQEGGKNAVKVNVANENIVAKQLSKDGKKTWEIPQTLDGDNLGYVDTEENTCSVKNYIPYSDSRAYTLNFENNTLQPDYKFSFMLGKNNMTVHKYNKKSLRPSYLGYYETIDFICSVYENDKDIVLEGIFTEDTDQITNKNSSSLNKIADKNGMERKQIIEIIKKECKREIPNNVIENSKGLCSYFKDVDKYFNKK